MAETQTSLTRSQVESSPLTTRIVREEAAIVRHNAGRANGCGFYDGCCSVRIAERDFAIRVLLAKGEIVRTNSRYFAA